MLSLPGDHGNLVDVRLSETRDRAAAEAFFASAQAVTHRTNRYLNNHLEQDPRGIKGRYRPMCGFKSVASAQRFCRAYDEVRHFLRSPSPRGHCLSLAERRWFHLAGSIGCLASWNKPPDQTASAELDAHKANSRHES